MELELYTLGHLVQFTGLTDRTLRNYLALGLLKGEKINGLWHFTPEEVDRFLRDPAVRPSIQAKANGQVYDFLARNTEPEDMTCGIFDFPGGDRAALSVYFCTAISSGGYEKLRFHFDGLGNPCRVILKGKTADVLELIKGWYDR